MKILAFGWWKDSGNIGDEAIYLGIKELFKGCEVMALPTLRFRKPFRTFREYMRVFNEANLIMMTGGTPIYDYDHLLRIFLMSLPKLCNKPFVLFGIGVKPIHSWIGKSLIRKLVSIADRISVRDPISKRILEGIGVKKECIVTGDSAMVLRGKEFNFNKKGFIAVCPRRLSLDYKKHYHQKLSGKQIKRIREKFKRIVENEEGEKLTLIFHTGHYDDDVREAEEIGLNYEKLIIKDPKKVLHLIAKSKKVIGTRLHSLIFAYMNNVDFKTIIYDVKIKGFLELIETYSKDEIISRINEEAKSVLDLAKERT